MFNKLLKYMRVPEMALFKNFWGKTLRSSRPPNTHITNTSNANAPEYPLTEVSRHNPLRKRLGSRMDYISSLACKCLRIPYKEIKSDAATTTPQPNYGSCRLVLVNSHK